MVAHQDMPYRAMGKSGLKLSALSLGGWTTFGGSVTDVAAVRTILHAAFERGVNFFDIADVYARGEAERVMGQALGELPRHELVISSKVFWPMSDDVNDRGLSRKHILESVDRTLQRIGTDYLDLYFCHRFDPETPVEETVRAMDDLVRQGKVLYWGTSEWTAAQLAEAHEVATRRNADKPRVEQPQYSLLVRDKVERFVAPAARELGMGLVVWSPLASGLLTGKYDDGLPDGSRLQAQSWLKDMLYSDDNRARVRAMAPLAEALGASRAQLALAWALSHPDVSSVITGATSLAQLNDNLGAATLRLDDDVRAQLDEIFAVA